MESIIEKDRETKNFFKNKIIKVPISIREAASKKMSIPHSTILV